MTAGDFDIVGAGWGPDFDDIMTFGDLFASWNLNNRGRYNNPEYDAAVRVAMNSTDPHTDGRHGESPIDHRGGRGCHSHL